MVISPLDKIFDTVVDTKKKLVSIDYSFKIRKYKHKPQYGYVYLFITNNGPRERINLDIEILLSDWDEKNSRLVENCKMNADYNLIMESYGAKITQSKIVHRLDPTLPMLTPQIMRHNLMNGLTRVNFVAYFNYKMNEIKNTIEPNTLKSHKSTYAKLLEFKPEIFFLDLDANFFNIKYRNYLKDVRKNNQTTINGSMVVIKKYLKLAAKDKIVMKMDLEDILTGSTSGNRTYLTTSEVKKLFVLFKVPFLDRSLKIVLGYFLFDCMTGLRIGDLLRLERQELEETVFSFYNQKSKTQQTMALANKAREILNDCPELFVEKFSQKHLNETIKKIMKLCSIEKEVCFHVGRHTFATCLIRAGVPVHYVQKLLKHKKIETTMVYVHILEEEANQEIGKLDTLFDDLLSA